MQNIDTSFRSSLKNIKTLYILPGAGKKEFGMLEKSYQKGKTIYILIGQTIRAIVDPTSPDMSIFYVLFTFICIFVFLSQKIKVSTLYLEPLIFIFTLY